jgi:hypothetical protein
MVKYKVERGTMHATQKTISASFRLLTFRQLYLAVGSGSGWHTGHRNDSTRSGSGREVQQPTVKGAPFNMLLLFELDF